MENSISCVNLTNQTTYLKPERICERVPDLGLLSPQCPKSDLDLRPRELSGSMQKTKVSGVDFSQIGDMQAYCLERLDELRCMNCKFPMVSSFSAILSYIGFLAHLCYSTSLGFDNAQFKKFCEECLVSLKVHIKINQTSKSVSNPCKVCPKCRVTTSKPSDTSLAAVLYGYLRCGLVHAFSIENSQVSNREKICVRISHKEIASAKTYQIKDVDLIHNVYGDGSRQLAANETIELQLNAFDLIDAVEKSISTMFDSASGLQSAILSSAALQYPVTF